MFSAGSQGKGQGGRQLGRRYKPRKPTFEGNDDDFLLPIAAPLLKLSKSVDKHARIDDDDVGVLLLDAALARVEILGSALPRTRTDSHWTVFLVPLIRLIGGGAARSGKPDTADGKLAAL